MKCENCEEHFNGINQLSYKFCPYCGNPLQGVKENGG